MSAFLQPMGVIGALAALGLLACGCAHGEQSAPAVGGGQVQPRFRSADPFVAFPCSDEYAATGSEPHELAFRINRLSLAVPVDYLTLKRVMRDSSRVLQAAIGVPCRHANDVTSCERSLSEMETRVEADASCVANDCMGRVYALSTLDDQVSVWVESSDLLRLLGAIDTPQDALLIAQVSEHAIGHVCGDLDASAYRPTEYGYQLRQRSVTSACHPRELTESVYDVLRDGSVRVVKRAVISSEPDACTVSMM